MQGHEGIHEEMRAQGSFEGRTGIKQFTRVQGRKGIYKGTKA